VPGRVGDIVATGRLRRLFWRMAGGPDYLVTLLRLRILDALAGPEPETPADQQRARDRERIERAFPNIEPQESRRRGSPSRRSAYRSAELIASAGGAQCYSRIRCSSFRPLIWSGIIRVPRRWIS
jgi:hypothetical protein